MVKFSEAVQIRTGGCAKCFSLTYTIPCATNKKIAGYFLKNFGKPIYPLESVKLLRIDTNDGYHIESRLETKSIKFIMPKKIEKSYPKKCPKQRLFESNLLDWMIDTLNINIELD